MDIYKCKTKGCGGFLTRCPKCGKSVVKRSTYYKELLKSRAVDGNTTNATKKEYLEIYTCEENTDDLEVYAGDYLKQEKCDGIVETCYKCGKFQFKRNDIVAAMKEYLKDTDWKSLPDDGFGEGTFWPHTFIRLLRWIAKEEPEILMKQTTEMINSFEELVDEYDEDLVPLMDTLTCFDFDDMDEEEAEEWYKDNATWHRDEMKEGLEKLINYVEFRT